MKLFNFSYENIAEINYKDFFWRLYTKGFDEEDLLSNAAQVAFYFAFALFPLLLFLVSLFGIVLGSADDLRTEMFFYLRQVMPNSAYELVQKTIQEVTESSSGGKLTFGILVALYSASAGIDSIRIVLNGVYNLTERRPFWKTKLTSLLMTFGLSILVMLALGIVFYGSKFVLLILNSISFPIDSPFILGALQWIIVLVVLVLIFALLYNFLPSHKTFKWIWVSPGAIMGIILWLLLSYSFSLYLSYFNSYDKTYGSLGAMIILMLWLYLTALVILIGGTTNAVLQEFTDPETAEAGANKAAAKEIVENPNASKDILSSGKKAEVLKAVSQNSADAKDQSENPKSENEKSDSNAEADKIKKTSSRKMKSTSNKSPLKLAFGLVVGLVENIFSSNKKK